MLLFSQLFILPVWILCVLYTAHKLVALTVTVFKSLNKICLKLIMDFYALQIWCMISLFHAISYTY